MKRCASLAMLALVAAMSGCAMCQNPWDYCNAVMGPGGPNCDFGARANSAFHPMGESPPTTQIGPTRATAASSSRTNKSTEPEAEAPEGDADGEPRRSDL